jgi:hypothetical protein
MVEEVKIDSSDLIKSCESPTLFKSSQSFQFESTQSTMLKSSESSLKPFKQPTSLSVDSLSQKLSTIYATEILKNPEKISQVTSPEPLASPSPEEPLSFLEVEAEETSKNSLYQWLGEIGLCSLFKLLVSQGYDDLNFLIEQMRTEPITLSLLEEIGVEKIGHRMILLAHLEAETEKFCRKSFPIKSNCCSKQPAVPSGHLKDWLQRMNLSNCYKIFIDSGFVSLDQMSFLMHSNYPITDEVLQEMGIFKIGYRQRILLKIREDSGAKPFTIDSDTKTAVCGECLII